MTHFSLLVDRWYSRLCTNTMSKSPVTVWGRRCVRERERGERKMCVGGDRGVGKQHGLCSSLSLDLSQLCPLSPFYKTLWSLPHQSQTINSQRFGREKNSTDDQLDSKQSKRVSTDRQHRLFQKILFSRIQSGWFFLFCPFSNLRVILPVREKDSVEPR